MLLKMTRSESAFNIFNYIFMILLSITMLYPFLNTFAKSLSSNHAVLTGQVLVIPKGFNTFAYKTVIDNTAFTRAILNTVFITVAGTLIHLYVVLTSAYALSRKTFCGKKVIFFYFLFTMFFSGGIIPSFLLIRSLKLYDSLWALILPSAMGVYHMIIARSFFEQLPESIIESAFIDGCNDFGIFSKIVLPVSKPVIATLALFAAVGYWNVFMAGIFYIRSAKNYPLQVIVRQMVFTEQTMMNTGTAQEFLADEMEKFGMESFKAAILMVSSLPILCVYPFLQKYFVKGITLGAVKG